MYIIVYYYQDDTPPRMLASFSSQKAAESAMALLKNSADKNGVIRYAHHRFRWTDLDLEYAPLWDESQLNI